MMAAINNLVISLFRHNGLANIAQARRRCNADLTFAISLLMLARQHEKTLVDEYTSLTPGAALRYDSYWPC